MRYLLFALVFSILGCTNQPKSTQKNSRENLQIEKGIWRFSFQLGKEQLPFNVKLEIDNNATGSATIINGDEQIKSKSLTIHNDSISIELPVFDSQLKGRIESKTLITGNWINKAKKNYKIPFIAEANKPYRFTPTKNTSKIADRYHVIFDPNTDDAWNAILLLNEDSNRYQGTFLTETGDYRYLEGNVVNGKLYLSTFDGSHAFLFTATVANDSLIDGTFTSGIHYSATWFAKADSNFSLRDPEKLTFLKPGYDKIDFRLPNQNGDTVTWNDMNLDGKVVILDIMGSWCPNCMDANRALKKLTSEYSDGEVVVVPIAYETNADFDTAKQRILKMQTDLGMKPHFLFGGKAQKENTAKDFPMLNHIMSYPTLIFIGKDRKVVDIYTGFYGPGTGKYYDQFMQHTDSLLKQLTTKNI